ncbi:MAG: hypothetical protein A2Z08_07955 [Deltaproteobacteria bacterium RBG_16_54_11]|nr:MAG: hypothetical protein A2Z08_07955 [Deltaproteobacteria bacterium RBG_16_54_11]
MNLYQCDDCGKQEIWPPKIMIKGYVPEDKGGILIPDQFHEYHFCSRECFEKWIGVAIWPKTLVCRECGWKPTPGVMIKCDDIRRGPFYCPDCGKSMGKGT